MSCKLTSTCKIDRQRYNNPVVYKATAYSTGIRLIPGGRAGGCSPPESGKAITFRENAKFFRPKSVVKMKKKILYLLNEKRNLLRLVPEIRDFFTKNQCSCVGGTVG